MCVIHNPSAITVGKIGKAFADENVFEPDYLLRIGSVKSMAGFPSWALRLTEIISIKRLKGRMTQDYFLALLNDYSNRDIRRGQ